MAAIHHVSLELAPAELDAARRFWTLLGFAETPAPAAIAGRAVWLAGASGQIHLLLDAPEPTAARQGHVAVEIGDVYDELVRTLDEAGYAVEPRAAHWGSPRCYVVAPGGHRVELMRDGP